MPVTDNWQLITANCLDIALQLAYTAATGSTDMCRVGDIQFGFIGDAPAVARAGT
jgi:hypothetical protein